MSEKEKERNSHIDYSKSDDNKYFVQKDLKELYQEEFGEALEKYNAKQKRNDRKIDDYYKHIQSGKKTSLQQEMIMQVGDLNDFISDAHYKKANE
ncbi:plasmid recombination protein, partial [Xenorhabdus sp. Vera]